MNSSRYLFYCLYLLPLISLAQVPEVESIASADGTSIEALIFHPNTIRANQPRPVIIALHGCGGLFSPTDIEHRKLNARHTGMAKLITDNGYSIIFPDSFTSRGEKSLCSQKLNERNIKQSHRTNDVDGILKWLSMQSWADTSKIGLLGWSHGGSAVLRSTDANRQQVFSRKIQPSLAIAFYPGCSDALKENYRPQVPLVIMLAELDDWTPPEPCIQLAKKTNSRIYIYPNSHHNFDNPIGSVRLRTDFPNGLNPGIGVHVGRNPFTGPQAWEQLLVTLRSQWQ